MKLRLKWQFFLWVCLVCASAAVAAEPAPREVLAFYYPWYGEVKNGHARHWNKVDAENHEISDSTHYPLRGAYSSQDPAVIDWQIGLAKTNGITGFIVSWWGKGTPEDSATSILLNRAAANHFKASVYWERFQAERAATKSIARRRILYIC